MAVVSRTTATYSHSHLPRRHFDRETRASVSNTFSCSTWDSAKKPSPTQRIVTRGGRVIVAASPPTEDAVVVTDPLTKQDLVDYLASGCKPREKWRCHFHVSLFASCLSSTRVLLYNCVCFDGLLSLFMFGLRLLMMLLFMSPFLLSAWSEH